jgi:hypothetical protein
MLSQVMIECMKVPPALSMMVSMTIKGFLNVQSPTSANVVKLFCHK